MRKINKPTTTAEESFKKCISKVNDLELKKRLEDCLDEIIEAEEEFERKVISQELHTIDESTCVNGNVSIKEMKKVYNYRMVSKTSPGRSIYDELMSIPERGRCPLCGQRTVSTLDHHLPKSKFPKLVVTPINLIATCPDCNKNKLDEKPISSEFETFHPYYDNIDGDIWLKARIHFDQPLSILFFVDQPDNWGTVKFKRIQHHFKLLKLNELYTSHASEELMNIKRMLKRLKSSLGREAVKWHLEESCESRRAIRNNSWQSAFYYELSTNEKFLDEGIELL